MYYTYVLQSKKDNGFYVGLTKDLKQRFEQHNKGLVESTKNRIPFNIIYYEACLDKNDALKREKYLNMKIIVPMAGIGSRLRPHTLTIPKPLTLIAGKPIVQRLVEDIVKVVDQKVEEIAFVIGPTFPKDTEEKLLKIFPEAVTIFLIPDNFEEWYQRLCNRKTETTETLKTRVETARQEMEQIIKFDYIVKNADNHLNDAVASIVSIIDAEHHRTAHRKISL